MSIFSEIVWISHQKCPKRHLCFSHKGRIIYKITSYLEVIIFKATWIINHITEENASPTLKNTEVRGPCCCVVSKGPWTLLLDPFSPVRLISGRGVLRWILIRTKLWYYSFIPWTSVPFRNDDLCRLSEQTACYSLCHG